MQNGNVCADFQNFESYTMYVPSLWVSDQIVLANQKSSCAKSSTWPCQTEKQKLSIFDSRNFIANTCLHRFPSN